MEDHVPRHAQMGAWVLINDRWYNLSPPFSTTNIYAEIDLEMKAKAMAICDIVEPGPIRPWKENKGLMAFLNSL